MADTDLLGEGVRVLLGSATQVLPALGLGVVRNDGAEHLEVVYVDALGATAYRARGDEVRAGFRPRPTDLRRVARAELEANTAGLVESRVLNTGLPDHIHAQPSAVRQVVTLPASLVDEPALLVVALGAADALTAGQTSALESLAARVAEFIGPLSARYDEIDLLRRLEAVETLPPAFFRAVDVREIFGRLSAITKDVLRHDFVTLGILSDDLERIEAYGRTAPDSSSPQVDPMPFPRVQTTAWLYRFVDELTANPLERDQASVKAGGRSSIRVAVRLDEKIVGALNFTSRDAVPYTAADLAIARRIADYVALALSHQRLADHARYSKELRARAEKSDRIDEALASVLDAGDLQGAFDRVSNVAQTVLPHDALLLAVRQPDGRRAKVCASKTPATRPFPTTLDEPPRLAGDPNWEFDLVADLQAAPDQQHLWTTQNGYRATLRLPIRLDDEFVGGLSFLSFTPAQYGVADVSLGRRIADRVALIFARERGALLLKRADEATERASRLEAQVKALNEELDTRTGARTVVGDSKAWRQVLLQATQVAAADTTVLLLGESGTGKEVVARFLHRASPRANGPFVALNCAALPEQLLEAELYGHERGAYTGATQSKPGRLEQAAGGTLFLDEVGEMSPSSQATFLRVLEQREFQRLGGTRVLRTDARTVAATNHDLDKAVAEGNFREDLFHRLNACAIHLPPLRDRRDDILPLSEVLLAEIGKGIGRPPSGISRDARSLLTDYSWPGNVRELRNLLERAAILCEGGLISAEHLALNVATKLAPSFIADVAGAGAGAGFHSSSGSGDLHPMERVMIEQALQSARFNKSKAAKVLGLTRQQLYVRLRKYGLD